MYCDTYHRMRSVAGRSQVNEHGYALGGQRLQQQWGVEMGDGLMVLCQLAQGIVLVDDTQVRRKDAGAARPPGQYGALTRPLAMEGGMSAVMEGGMRVHELLRVVGQQVGQSQGRTQDRTQGLRQQGQDDN